jgi:hypothetical protein
MSTARARLAVRALVLALVLALAAVLALGSPGVGAAQDGAEDADEAPADVPAEAPSPIASPPGVPAPSPIPLDASPTPTPGPEPLPGRDWRSVGYASVVDGQLYDPFCRPLRSIGSNVPNLLFRDGLRENLEWMRQRQMRWLRVIATGHGTLLPREQITLGNVAQRLAELLREVEAFNAGHPPGESIYVVVNFTDYYEPGVPGDQYGFDHAGWCNARVLNAPWYRRGVPRYSYQQECGGGRLVDAPNYEVNYKPWVERLVAVGARSPALLGWQLGNEMKSRDTTPDDGIDEALGWYVDWMADMTDTIRAIDRNHLILTGTQYLAELTDYAYRPRDGDPVRAMIPGYGARFEKLLRGCNEYCWNVWTLTNYDFHHYAIDDAMYLQRLTVPVMITEHGFTLGTPDEERDRFGGDRVAALRSGRNRPWVDLDGNRRPYDWSTIDLIDSTGLQGVAPWASPAPSASASPWMDLDAQRGVSLAREGDALWQVWQEIAGRLEASNGQRGVSQACLSFVSN